MNKFPKRYIPNVLSSSDRKKQRKNIKKSRKLYKQHKYYTRPKVKTFKSRKSNHLSRARKLYSIKNIKPSTQLSTKTKCTEQALEKIVNKGRGAYYSSGSRPNQSAESWGLARLASSITGGNASISDYHILKEGCKPTSRALKMARKTCKLRNKTCK